MSSLSFLRFVSILMWVSVSRGPKRPEPRLHFYCKCKLSPTPLKRKHFYGHVAAIKCRAKGAAAAEAEGAAQILTADQGPELRHQTLAFDLVWCAIAHQMLPVAPKEGLNKSLGR